MRVLLRAALTLVLSRAPLGAAADLPSFALENYDGRPITNATFEGKTTIVVPTFAKCIFACPMITFLLTELDKELGSPESMQYLHVSVQPEEDTAEEILAHFDKHEIVARRDTRWLFANAPESAIRRFLEDIRVTITRTPVEGGEVIEHTIQVYVVGPDGKTVARFDTYLWDEKEMTHAVRSSLR